MSDQNFTTAEFDNLLEDTGWLDPIADFSLDFDGELSAFGRSSMVDGSLSLTSERIEAQFEGAGIPMLYTLSLTGSGIDPVSSSSRGPPGAPAPSGARRRDSVRWCCSASTSVGAMSTA